jgi:transposase-like protein
MMYVWYPLSLRQVEDLLFERGIDICHETVRFWWNRFGQMFAAEIWTATGDRYGPASVIPGSDECDRSCS